MPMVFLQGDQRHYQQISEDLRKYHLGDYFSKGTIAEQVRLTIYFKTKVKYLYSSLWMRSGGWQCDSDAKPFPYQMTLGAIQNDSLLYEMGYAAGESPATTWCTLILLLQRYQYQCKKSCDRVAFFGIRIQNWSQKRQECFYVVCKMES